MQKILTRDNVLALDYLPDYSCMYVILKPSRLAEKYRHLVIPGLRRRHNMTIKFNGNFWVVFNGLVEVAWFRKLEAAQQYIDVLDYVTCLRMGRHEY